MRIITHSGQAHRDEILAIALLAVKSGVHPRFCEILRVPEWPNSTDSVVDTSRPPVAPFVPAYVIDIGKKHDPALGLFDHHQFPADAPPACALTLLADHYSMDMSKYPWMEKVAILDSKGIFKWFEMKFGRRPSNAAEVAMALDDKTSIFSYIERVANKVSFHEALDIAYGWMKDEIEHVEFRDSNIAEARKLAKVVDLTDSHRMVFFDVEKMPPCGMSLVDIMAVEDPGIIVAGKFDERSDGYSATRLLDNPLVDFNRVRGEKRCKFVHANGFCLKWKKDWDSFLSAIKQSIGEVS